MEAGEIVREAELIRIPFPHFPAKQNTAKEIVRKRKKKEGEEGEKKKKKKEKEKKKLIRR